MVKINISLPVGYKTEDIKDAVCKILPVAPIEINDIRIMRQSLSLKDKSRPEYKLTVALGFSPEREAGLLKMRKTVSPLPDYTLTPPTVSLSSRPVVVGCGPCGLFAALLLAEAGARPIVLERGESVRDREVSVRLFSTLGILNPESNVQFGEGGAGTFSDGKLKVGGMDKYKMKVLTEFVSAGATEDITYSDNAHLGTDKLPSIVENLRKKAESYGAEFIFSAKFVDYTSKDGKLFSVTYEKSGERITLPASDLILALGHSAKDTAMTLYEKGVPIEARGFGIGMRIEHPREYINELVYGKGYDSRLGTASYHLVTHLSSGRSVYSFCMCPGGTVVPAANEEGGIVTNGMSVYDRNGENSNAALLVSVTPKDFSSDSPLAGMELQRRIERAAFAVAGNTYRAPAIRLSDFTGTNGIASVGATTPTYPIGTVAARPEDYLPSYVTESLKAAIVDFDEWMPGYNYSEATLTGPETRTTSPIRVLRNESYMIPCLCGVYPAGEGAGYSGGIVSSATDGLKVAEALLCRYK